MADVRISDIAAKTGFSMRYWQRRVARCEVPGARSIALGKRKGYVLDSERFETWWLTQLQEVIPCQKTSAGAGRPGGTALIGEGHRKALRLLE